MFVLTLLNVLETEWPKLVRIATAAMATSAAIRAYSTIVTAVVSLARAEKAARSLPNNGCMAILHDGVSLISLKDSIVVPSHASRNLEASDAQVDGYYGGCVALNLFTTNVEGADYDPSKYL